MFQRIETNPLIERLRVLFYNGIAELAFSEIELNAENIDDYFKLSIMQIILNTINASKDLDSETLRINEGFLINNENCPNIYLDFFQGLKSINNRIQALELYRDLSLKELPFLISSQIEILALKLMDSMEFKQMLPQLNDFIFEARGINQVLLPLDLIRQTFYNEMVTQTLEALSDGLISKDALEGQESFIYFALSSLTILEAILHSNQVNGIVLLGHKVVTRENSPQNDNFPAFVDIILNAKALMQEIYGPAINISAQELIVIKQLCLSRGDEISPLSLTQNASNCAALINKMSIQISQTAMFKKMIPEVIEFCLESLETTTQLGM